MAGGGKTEKVLPRITYSIGHEMGIMFGFIGLMLLATAGFTVFWVGKNKRQARLERERQDVLRQAGWGLDGWKRNEKGAFKSGVQEDRVEKVDGEKQTTDQIRMQQAMDERGQSGAFRGMVLREGQPEIVAALSEAQNITILAPSNETSAKFLALQGNENVATQIDLVAALLQVCLSSYTDKSRSTANTNSAIVPRYLRWRLDVLDFTETAAFAPTLLTNTSYTNVTGGQVVEGFALQSLVAIDLVRTAHQSTSQVDLQ